MAKFYSAGCILRARVLAIELPSAGKSVLVLGVGGGAELKKALIKSDSVEAIDSSASMLDQAKHNLRISGGNMSKVSLQQADFWELQGSYDCVICPFFLNVFAEEEMRDVVHKLKQLLNDDPRSELIIADFSPYDRWWWRPFQWLYYTPPRILFKLLTNNPWHPLYDYSFLFLDEFSLCHRKKVDWLGFYEVLCLRVRHHEKIK